MKARRYTYKVVLRWQEAKKGMLSASANKPNIEIATPPEFHGHADIWNPEELFVASVNSCIMTTFLHYAERDSLELLGYTSEAEGILEYREGEFIFSEITVRPKILVKRDSDIKKAEEVILRSEKNCLISNSIKSRVIVLPEIEASAHNSS